MATHDGDLKSYRARPEGMFLLHPDEVLVGLVILLAFAIVLDRVGML